MILQWALKEKGPKGRRGQEFRAHSYPTVSSRPRGRRVQSLIPIGSEMWIWIRYKQTNKHSSLYIRFPLSLVPICVHSKNVWHPCFGYHWGPVYPSRHSNSQWPLPSHESDLIQFDYLFLEQLEIWRMDIMLTRTPTFIRDAREMRTLRWPNKNEFYCS